MHYKIVYWCINCDGTGKVSYRNHPEAKEFTCEVCEGVGKCEVIEEYSCIDDLERDYPDMISARTED